MILHVFSMYVCAPCTEKVLQLYESADQTLSVLHRLGAMVLHGVDATTMEKHHIIRMTRFDRIVYNFPHAGFYGKEDDGKVIRCVFLRLEDFFIQNNGHFSFS